VPAWSGYVERVAELRGSVGIEWVESTVSPEATAEHVANLVRGLTRDAEMDAVASTLWREGARRRELETAAGAGRRRSRRSYP
jgi:hypothetical protein